MFRGSYPLIMLLALTSNEIWWKRTISRTFITRH